MASRRIRIGNGCGFWGDNLDAPVILAERGGLDYLTLEYLAELTMSIMAMQKQRDAGAGYASDFLDVLDRLSPILKDQPGLKVITNAGGMNPRACALKARSLLDRGGLSDRAIAFVTGDDILPQLDTLMGKGHLFAHLDTTRSLAGMRPRVVSANAYLGSQPIVLALRQGASIVITGRVADASLTVAPAIHEFGWDWRDWDRLAGATVAGHLIECGAQVTGGLWCNWNETDLSDVGYPIAEISQDGSFTITKPSGTGGVVNRETVAEQLLYEVGDPEAYLTPDVTADFTSVKLTESARDVVRVGGAKGNPAPEKYKVSIAYRDGFMASGMLVVAGPEAPYKARRSGEMILSRLRRAGAEPEHSLIECLGAGGCVPGLHRVIPPDIPEVVLRVAVRDSRRAVVERFTRELAPLVTSGPPGITGYATGRPRVREVFAYWPALIPVSEVTPEVEMI